MTVQDWGAIGELVSAIAIIVTLIYLAVQVKYARVAASDASRANRRAGIHEINSFTVNNQKIQEAWLKTAGPELTDIYVECAEELNITIEESNLLFAVVSDWMFLHWAQYRSIKTPEDEAELKNIVSSWYSTNPMKTFVANDGFRSFFDPGFIVFLDESVSKEPLGT